MTADQNGVRRILADQIQHQVRLHRKWMTWWIPLIFVVGLCVSIVGLVPAIAAFREQGAVGRLVVFGVSTALFGWAVLMWLLGPLLISPRIVPYFARELGELGGKTMAAFPRGREVYREMAALEELARSLGVRPLSAFGFAYDHYEQEVRWHPATEGVQTIEALRRGLDVRLSASPGLVDDLEALAQAVRAAADRAVDFSLVLRLHAKDSMQMVCTRETRQGSFW